MEKIIQFNELPCEIRNRLIKYKGSWLDSRESPEGSKWVFMEVSLDKLYDSGIYSMPPDAAEDETEAEALQRFKNEYLERRCYTPLILDINMERIIDGLHHLTAFGMAVDEDGTLPKIIECWVRVN